MANELKPCICGKTPRLDIKKGLAGITKVPFYREQIMCRCGVSSKIFKAPRKAVEAWNTRHGTLTNEGTTIPTPVAPVSPDATGKCEELVTVGYAPSEYDMGLDYQQLGISRLYPKSCASGAVAVVTRSQAEELLAAERARCAEIAREFSTSAHVAHSIKAGCFPEKSDIRDAIADAIMGNDNAQK